MLNGTFFVCGFMGMRAFSSGSLGLSVVSSLRESRGKSVSLSVYEVLQRQDDVVEDGEEVKRVVPWQIQGGRLTVGDP